MFPIKRCVRRDGTLECAILELVDVRRSCQLVPRFGEERIDRTLTPLTVLDGYDSFFLNNRVDKDAY